MKERPLSSSLIVVRPLDAADPEPRSDPDGSANFKPTGVAPVLGPVANVSIWPPDGDVAGFLSNWIISSVSSPRPGLELVTADARRLRISREPATEKMVSSHLLYKFFYD